LKGIIYCRVSSQDQVQGTSLERQQQACEEYAKRNNITVEEIFIERGESATAANRTEFLKAIERCSKGKDIGAFIVWKLDRFARDVSDHFTVRAMLLKYNTTLHSVTEPITNDPQGQLMETMLAGFAQFENEIRKQRCTGGMRGSLKKGLYIWDSKFGYKRPKKLTKRVTEPDVFDEPRASLLRKGMLLYAEGFTSISELEELSEEWGLLSRTGRTLSKQRWSDLLSDKYYAGVLTDPWDGKEYKGAHTALITLDTFYKIQQVKKRYGKKKQERLKKNPNFPLKTFVRCHECENYLTGSSPKGRKEHYDYYHCIKCGIYVKKSVLETAFIEYLSSVAPIPEYIELFNQSVVKAWEIRKLEVTTERNNYGERIAALKTRLAQITEMYIDGDLDKEAFRDRSGTIKEQLATLEISENESEITRLDLEARLEYAKNNINNLARLWQDVDITQKTKLQRAVLPEGIIYNKTKGRFGTAPLSYLYTFFWTFPMEESVLVAGPGIEPGSGGYEPPEVPLLYPALHTYMRTKFLKNSVGEIYTEKQCLANLYTQFIEHSTIATDCVFGNSLGQNEVCSFMSNAVTNLMGLPCFIE
jgi:site-specific DNA recombinase